MRALELEMSAFGPYRRKQHIDFTKLGKEPIFLITGPTGAGKTTIFDAICFSLYGRASGTERDQDVMRSHFAHFSEMTSVRFLFSLHNKTYCITRSPKQKKPKRRGEGYTEEPAAAHLYLLNTDKEWELLVSKIKEVNETIEELIGLDYEQFKKMIMIPQGEFRKLISENSKEREEVLQKIFRTYFYKNITEKFKEKAKSLEEEVAQLRWKKEQELEKLPADFIDQEAEKQIPIQLEQQIFLLKEEQNNINKQLTAITQKKAEVSDLYYHQKKIADYFDEYADQLEYRKELAKKLPVIEEKKSQLYWAKSADKIHPLEEQMKTREQEWKVQQQEAELLTECYKREKENFATIKEEYEKEQKKEDKRESLKIQLQEQKKMLEEIRNYQKLMQQLHQLQNNLKATEQEEKQWDQQIAQLEEQKEKIYVLKDELYHIRQTLQRIDHESLQRAERINNARELKAEYQELLILRKDYQQYIKVVNKLERKLEEQSMACKKMEQERKEHIASYLAEQLKEGDTCPVCGSTHHPYLAVSPAKTATEEMLEQALEQQSILQNEANEMKLETTRIQEQGEAKKRIVQHLLHAAGIDKAQLTVAGLEMWITQLIQKQEEIEKEKNNLIKKEKTIQTQLRKIQSATQQIDLLKKEQEKLKNKKQQELQNFMELKATVSHLKEKLPMEVTSLEAFEEKLVKLDNEIKNMELKWQEIQKEYEKIAKLKNNLETKAAEAERFALQFQKKYLDAQTNFREALKKHEFSSVEAYHNSLLLPEEQQQIESMISQLEEQQNLVEDRLRTLSGYIKHLKKPDLTETETELDILAAKWEKQTKHLQTVALQINQLEQILINITELDKKITKLDDEYFHVGELASLARGDNPAKLSFERFVLATFLDEILLQANIRLDQMSGHRYQLHRSQEIAKRGAQSGLDLEVMDHHTGRKRSVKTLSGGEGFKASLSLALGMADIIQAHAGGIQLDTLFIDEGFGTLDEISLEQAISCLKGLQHDNRIIGVISHVNQLKEEIKAKLVVGTSPSGSSVNIEVG